MWTIRAPPDFNPRSPWGERLRLDPSPRRRSYFNPRSPWGERPKNCKHQCMLLPFQSTLPVGGATRILPGLELPIYISIHAPRGGSDRPQKGRIPSWRHFNPRSPWGERLVLAAVECLTSDFNPRSPWGERQLDSGTLLRGWQFQSTLPVGGATTIKVFAGCHDFISIHAPRGGSDGTQPHRKSTSHYFNPRSPWGERPPEEPICAEYPEISIHAPRGGSDI